MKFHLSRRHMAAAVCLAAVLTAGVLFVRHTAAQPAACRMEDLSPWPAPLPFDTPAAAPSPAPAEKRVFLTFDDGPSEYTEDILDILKEKQAVASFFVIAAENNQEYLPLLQRIEQEGHTIALHSCTHDYAQIYTSTAAYWQDIEQLKQAISPYITTPPVWLRFPGGSTNTVSRKYGGSGLMEKLNEQAAEKGYKVLDWNVCANDAVGANPSADKILRTVQKDSEGLSTCVVLLHDTKQTKTTVEALPAMIDWYAQQGFRFCALGQEAP